MYSRGPMNLTPAMSSKNITPPLFHLANATDDSEWVPHRGIKLCSTIGSVLSGLALISEDHMIEIRLYISVSPFHTSFFVSVSSFVRKFWECCSGRFGHQMVANPAAVKLLVSHTLTANQWVPSGHPMATLHLLNVFRRLYTFTRRKLADECPLGLPGIFFFDQVHIRNGSTKT